MWTRAPPTEQYCLTHQNCQYGSIFWWDDRRRGVQLYTLEFGVLDLVKLEILEIRPFGLTKTSVYTTYH